MDNKTLHVIHPDAKIGRQVEIGRFLNEVERQELAYELQQVIRTPV